MFLPIIGKYIAKFFIPELCPKITYAFDPKRQCEAIYIFSNSGLLKGFPPRHSLKRCLKVANRLEIFKNRLFVIGGSYSKLHTNIIDSFFPLSH